MTTTMKTTKYNRGNITEFASRFVFGFIVALFIFFAAAMMANAAESRELAGVTTEWKAIGANHKVIVTAYQDPDIPEIMCYVSQAKTGGIKGSIGLAEDPSNFALACVKTGTPTIKKSLPKEEQLFTKSTNIWFKSTRVTRIYDKENEVVVYLAISRHLIDGSPFNAIAAVPLK